MTKVREVKVKEARGYYIVKMDLSKKVRETVRWNVFFWGYPLAFSWRSRWSFC